MATFDLIGQTINQYHFIEPLGKGGMAAVYRAHQTTMDRDVAVKIINPDLAIQSEFSARFEREAKMLASLQHLHILKVFDYGQYEDLYYLVMELLVGGSLADLIGQGPLSIELAMKIFGQIGSALDYAHRRGIIHRDLKPGNVLLDNDKNAYLTDFGLAKLIDGGPKLTQTGIAMGTPAYMSPEQWQGGNLDARADIYSLGIILYEMISGKLPFNGDTPFRLMHMHIYENHPALLDSNPDMPHAVDLVIARALAKNPEDRFVSAGDMVAALQDAISSHPANVTGQPKVTMVPVPGNLNEGITRPSYSSFAKGAPSTSSGRVSLANPESVPGKAAGVRSLWPIMLGAIVVIVVLVGFLFIERQGAEQAALRGTQTAVAQAIATLTAQPTNTIPPSPPPIKVIPNNQPPGGPTDPNGNENPGDPGGNGPGGPAGPANGEPNGSPNDPAYTPPTGPVKEGTFILSPRKAANIYTVADRNSRIIRAMKPTEKFTILGSVVVAGQPMPWFLIQVDEQTQGWVFSQEAFVFPPGTRIPMITLTPASN